MNIVKNWLPTFQIHWRYFGPLFHISHVRPGAWICMRAVNTMSIALSFPVQVIYLTNSGSEANDLAMLMARLHTGSYDIITFRYKCSKEESLSRLAVVCFFNLGWCKNRSPLWGTEKAECPNCFCLLCSSRGSYHGGSPQTMGLTSNAAYKYPIANGLGCTNVRMHSFIWMT